jgi:cytochrome c-type biogenesis protein CcmH/NrfG
MFPRVVGLWILGVLCVLFAITSYVSWRVLQRVSRRERLFSRLADQLRQDAQALENLTGTDERD